MSNNSHSPITEMLSGKYKIWLMIGLALMSVADLSACIALWAFGASAGYWFVTFVMAVVDVLYLLGVALSNQRFKYARLLFIVYIAVSALFILIWLCETLLQNEVTFDNVAVVIWSLLHTVGIVAAVITYIYAARVLRGGRTIQLGLAIAFSVVAFVCAIYYVISIGYDGYFGQGGDTLPLVYEYIGDNECEVTGIVYGKGDRVVVPYEFNGRKVTKVSAHVLTDGITRVTLKCDTDTALFTDIYAVNGVNRNVVLNAEKDRLDAFKTALYGRASTRALGDRLRPSDLAADEVFITFSYDEQSFEMADKTLLPTWYGKKGDVYKLSDVKDVPYSKATDVNSDDDLYYSYNNTKKFIMTAPSVDGKQINGAAITSSCVNVPVRFQRVYRVYPCESDDTMYDTTEHFAFSEVNGKKLDYKLFVADNADSIIDAFSRDGFTRTMYYSADGGIVQDACEDESSALIHFLDENGDNVKIRPLWKLITPVANVSPAQGATNSAMYGEKFSLSATITHPILSELDLKYEWYENGEKLNNNSATLDVAKTDYAGSGQYAVVVTVSAPDITSCTASSNTATITMNISPRPLSVAWSELSENVYNDDDFYVTATLGNTIAGDDIGLLQSSFKMHDAKTYEFTAELYGYDEDCYYIVEDDEVKSYTIAPCPINVYWDEVRSFEYNGGELIPRIEAYDLHGNPLTMTKIGAQINVGEDYTASAVVRSNTNYVVSDDPANTVTFSIYPKTVDAIWGKTEFTYDGWVQHPYAHIIGVDDEEIRLNVEGGQRNANIINGVKTEQYIAVASSPDKNYTVNPETSEKEFTIDQCERRIVWSSITELTYTGKPQAPTAMYYQLNGFTRDAVVSGLQINAITDVGQKYTATATIEDTNFKIEPGYESKQYTIIPYVANVEWTNTTLTYNGEAQKPTATAKGALGENLALNIIGDLTDAGENYPAAASLAVADNNYRLGNNATTFTIKQKDVTVTWTDTVLTYNGDTQSPTASAIDINGNNLTLYVSGGKTNFGDYTATVTTPDGNYNLLNPTQAFVIEKAEAQVVWANATFPYNGQTQTPTASALGVDGNALPLTVIGGGKNVNDNGVAVAETTDSNYRLTNSTCEVTITPMSVQVVWTNTTLTYNGEVQVPTAMAYGVDGKSIPLKLLGGAKNVNDGESYTAIAVNTNDNYVLTNDRTEFNITKKKITVTADSVTAVYGETPSYTGTVSGLVVGDDVAIWYTANYTVDEYGNIPVGTYDIAVKLSGSASGNYSMVVTSSGTLTVTAPEKEEE